MCGVFVYVCVRLIASVYLLVPTNDYMIHTIIACDAIVFLGLCFVSGLCTFSRRFWWRFPWYWHARGYDC